MSPLERYYRWLLRAYPKPYRTGRADEILGTLLDTASPGQRLPSARESAALIFGGIRARVARNADMPVLASLRLSAILAVATFTQLGFVRGPEMMWSNTRNEWAAYALLLAATVLVWFVRREIAVPVLLTALAALCSLRAHSPAVIWAVVGLIVLTALRAERPPRRWLVWFCLPAAYWLIFVPPFFDANLRIGGHSATTLLGLLLLILFVTLPVVWAVTDGRPAFALSLLVAYLISETVLRLGADGAWPLAWYSVSVVLALPLLVRIARHRRQVAL
jgi:hypothetical protein